MRLSDPVGRIAQSLQRLATAWTVRGSNPGGGWIFRTCPDLPWGPLSLLCNGYRVFPGGKKRPGRDADPSPPSSAVIMKEQSYTCTPLMGRTVCTEPQCLYKGVIYFTLLYFTLLYFTLLYFTLLYFTLLYFILLYFTLLYFTLLYFTLLYFTLLVLTKQSGNFRSCLR